MEVPEFFKAYLDRNSGDQNDFPEAKVQSRWTKKDPAKYDKLRAEYQEAVHHYIEQNPDSIDGIDLSLRTSIPAAKWNQREAKRGPEIHRIALDLAQSKYLVARTETDLQGEGFLKESRRGNIGSARSIYPRCRRCAPAVG